MSAPKGYELVGISHIRVGDRVLVVDGAGTDLVPARILRGAVAARVEQVHVDQRSRGGSRMRRVYRLLVDHGWTVDIDPSNKLLRAK